MVLTLLDISILVVLLLLAVGGYRQGLVRGSIWLLALFAICLLGGLMAWSLGPADTLRGALVQAGVVVAGVALAVAIIAWLVDRLVPEHRQAAQWNRLLGMLPALVQGLVVIALLLGLAHRLAITPQQQAYIEQGWISGPLSLPLGWLERIFTQ